MSYSHYPCPDCPCTCDLIFEDILNRSSFGGAYTVTGVADSFISTVAGMVSEDTGWQVLLNTIPSGWSNTMPLTWEVSSGFTWTDSWTLKIIVGYQDDDNHLWARVCPLSINQQVLIGKTVSGVETILQSGSIMNNFPVVDGYWNATIGVSIGHAWTSTNPIGDTAITVFTKTISDNLENTFSSVTVNINSSDIPGGQAGFAIEGLEGAEADGVGNSILMTHVAYRKGICYSGASCFDNGLIYVSNADFDQQDGLNADDSIPHTRAEIKTQTGTWTSYRDVSNPFDAYIGEQPGAANSFRTLWRGTARVGDGYYVNTGGGGLPVNGNFGSNTFEYDPMGDKADIFIYSDYVLGFIDDDGNTVLATMKEEGILDLSVNGTSVGTADLSAGGGGGNAQAFPPIIWGMSVCVAKDGHLAANFGAFGPALGGTPVVFYGCIDTGHVYPFTSTPRVYYGIARYGGHSTLSDEDFAGGNGDFSYLLTQSLGTDCGDCSNVCSGGTDQVMCCWYAVLHPCGIVATDTSSDITICRQLPDLLVGRTISYRGQCYYCTSLSPHMVDISECVIEYDTTATMVNDPCTTTTNCASYLCGSSFNQTPSLSFSTMGFGGSCGCQNDFANLANGTFLLFSSSCLPYGYNVYNGVNVTCVDVPPGCYPYVTSTTFFMSWFWEIQDLGLGSYRLHLLLGYNYTSAPPLMTNSGDFNTWASGGIMEWFGVLPFVGSCPIGVTVVTGAGTGGGDLPMTSNPLSIDCTISMVDNKSLCPE